MIVQVELKTLLEKLAEFNPESDLTAVKAYLLDLALGNPVNESITVPARPAPSRAQTSSVPVPRAMEGVPPVTEAAEGFDMEDEKTPNDGVVLGNLIGTAPVGSPTIKKVISGKGSFSSKEEREARRAKARQFTEMSSKEILESLTAKDEATRRGANKQLVDEGSEGGGHSGEIELG